MSRLDEIDLSSGLAGEAFASSSASAKKDLAKAEVFREEEPLARARILPNSSASGKQAFVDLPLRPGMGASRSADWVPESAPPGIRAQAAPFPARGAALVADGALVLLLVAAASLAATAGRGEAFEPAGLLWACVFAFYLSFFSTVVPLMLFGKTVGMALTGLTARGQGGAPLTATQSARRWLGTVLTLLALGVPLLVSRRDCGARSPGDRLSGRPLVWESRN